MNLTGTLIDVPGPMLVLPRFATTTFGAGGHNQLKTAQSTLANRRRIS